jgi:hypothetical protein
MSATVSFPLLLESILVRSWQSKYWFGRVVHAHACIRVAITFSWMAAPDGGLALSYTYFAIHAVLV